MLLDFFYKPRSHGDDIVASDFVPHWDTLRPKLGPYFADADRKKRLNKALAHLTLKRLEYDRREKKWNILAIRSEVEAVIDAFIDNLAPDRKPWFAHATSE